MVIFSFEFKVFKMFSQLYKKNGENIPLIMLKGEKKIKKRHFYSNKFMKRNVLVNYLFVLTLKRYQKNVPIQFDYSIQ